MSFSVAVVLLAQAFATARAQHPVFTEADLDAGRVPEYELKRVEGCRMLALEGSLQIGITAALRSALAEFPQTTGLVLESDGGNVYQARGLAAVVRVFALDTYVFSHCHSACTTVFLAGRRRYVGENAAIGFHEYRMDNGRAHPAVDVSREQRKDHANVSQQIGDARFVERLLHLSGRQLWTPGVSMLVTAGVAHRKIRDIYSGAVISPENRLARRARCGGTADGGSIGEALAHAAPPGIGPVRPMPRKVIQREPITRTTKTP